MKATLSKIGEALAGLFALACICALVYAMYLDHVNPRVDAPTRSNSPDWAAALMTVYPVGKPMMVDGCKVTVHRVAVSSTLNDFTLATAQCPTATVTSTEQSCGKNCHSSDIRVQQPVPAEPPASAPLG